MTLEAGSVEARAAEAESSDHHVTYGEFLPGAKSVDVVRPKDEAETRRVIALVAQFKTQNRSKPLDERTLGNLLNAAYGSDADKRSKYSVWLQALYNEVSPKA